MSEYNYYFANARLCMNVLEQAEDGPAIPEEFISRQPYAYTVELKKADGPIPAYETPVSYNENNSVAPCEDGFLFFLSADRTAGPRTALHINRDYSACTYYITERGVDDPKKNRALDHLRTVFDGVLPTNGGTILHSSCVKYQGKAVLFAAPSRTGKSTHAKLWGQRFKAPMLSSDAPAVYPTAEGAMAYGMPWDGSDRIRVQDSAPVAAIVELRQAARNSIRRLSKKQAFRMLLGQGHLPMWDSQAMFREMAVLKKLAASVPFYRLNCLPEISAAELVYEAVFGTGEQVMNVEDEMKIKDEYILRDVMDEKIVLPSGSAMKEFKGAVVLNETSAFVWEKLQKNIARKDLLDSIVDEFDVDEETAAKDLDHFLEKLDSFGVLEHIPA